MTRKVPHVGALQSTTDSEISLYSGGHLHAGHSVSTAETKDAIRSTDVPDFSFQDITGWREWCHSWNTCLQLQSCQILYPSTPHSFNNPNIHSSSNRRHENSQHTIIKAILKSFLTICPEMSSPKLKNDCIPSLVPLPNVYIDNNLLPLSQTFKFRKIIHQFNTSISLITAPLFNLWQGLLVVILKINYNSL